MNLLYPYGFEMYTKLVSFDYFNYPIKLSIIIVTGNEIVNYLNNPHFLS